MKIYVYIFTILLILSCGTRKKEVHKKLVEVNKIEKKDLEVINTNDIQSNVSIIEHELITHFTPVDEKKPMIIDGHEYINTKVSTGVHSKEVDSRTSDKSINKTKDNSEYREEKATKDIKMELDRDNSFGFWDWFWLLLAIVVVGTIVIKRKSILSFFINLFKSQSNFP